MCLGALPYITWRDFTMCLGALQHSTGAGSRIGTGAELATVVWPYTAWFNRTVTVGGNSEDRKMNFIIGRGSMASED